MRHIRVTLSAMSLLYSAFLVTQPTFASPILGPNCALVPALCTTYQASSGGAAGLTAGSNSVPVPSSPNGGWSPSGATSISDERQYPQNLFADSSYNFSVGYSGMHVNLGAYSNYNVGSGSALGAGATFVGYIQDYVATTNHVAPGSNWDFTYSVDATGNTSQKPLGQGGDYETDIEIALYSSMGGITKCSDGNNSVGGIYGSYSTTCTLSIPVTQLTVVPLYLFEIAHANSEDGQATLDSSHTGKIDSIELVDASGNVIPDAQIFDASGYDYNAVAPTNPTPVPEPFSLTFLGTGIAALVGARYRPRPEI